MSVAGLEMRPHTNTQRATSGRESEKAGVVSPPRLLLAKGEERTSLKVEAWLAA